MGCGVVWIEMGWDGDVVGRKRGGNVEKCKCFSPKHQVFGEYSTHEFGGLKW